MEADEETKFKELRHRFYRLGHHGQGILIEMGVLPEPIRGVMATLGEQRFSMIEIRERLFNLADQGRLPELETLITKKEAEILAQIGHVGDPCQFCNLPHVQVKPGPCPVRKKMVQP